MLVMYMDADLNQDFHKYNAPEVKAIVGLKWLGDTKEYCTAYAFSDKAKAKEYSDFLVRALNDGVVSEDGLVIKPKKW